MSIIELDIHHKIIYINSIFNIYGTHANDKYANIIKEEIETMWNAPKAIVNIENNNFQIRFNVQTNIYHLILQQTIKENTSYLNNYIRIEEASKMHVSFVDGILSNTGYFIVNNLEQGSTVAHEFGHMLGLKHPDILDIRGNGQPHIMYPRGTLVDPQFQYDANVNAGQPGGTVNPTLRIVTQENIDDLMIKEKILNNQLYIGKLSNIYHEKFDAATNIQT